MGTGLLALFLWGNVAKVKNVLNARWQENHIKFWKQSPFKHFDEANYLVIYVHLTLLSVLVVNEGNFQQEFLSLY